MKYELIDKETGISEATTLKRVKSLLSSYYINAKRALERLNEDSKINTPFYIIIATRGAK